MIGQNLEVSPNRFERFKATLKDRWERELLFNRIGAVAFLAIGVAGGVDYLINNLPNEIRISNEVAQKYEPPSYETVLIANNTLSMYDDAIKQLRSDGDEEEAVKLLSSDSYQKFAGIINQKNKYDDAKNIEEIKEHVGVGRSVVDSTAMGMGVIAGIPMTAMSEFDIGYYARKVRRRMRKIITRQQI